MRFKCKVCGRDDEIIGDSSPHCLYCNVPLLRATESYAGLLMSPEIVLRRMKTLVEKHGLSRVENGPFKHEREAWSTAIYALALSEINGKKYWVEIETSAQTPDSYLHCIDQSSGSNVDQIQSIEVVDWEEHNNDLLTLVEKKVKKAYPQHYCLLITGRSGQLLEPHAFATKLLELTIPFAEIWIIGMPAYDTVNIARLFPDVMVKHFALSKALIAAKTEYSFMVKQQRGVSTEFVPLGSIYLPIP